jgi:hypothetical protein
VNVTYRPLLCSGPGTPGRSEFTQIFRAFVIVEVRLR